MGWKTVKEYYGIKRNAKANGCTIDGRTYQAWPKTLTENQFNQQL